MSLSAKCPCGKWELKLAKVEPDMYIKCPKCSRLVLDTTNVNVFVYSHQASLINESIQCTGSSCIGCLQDETDEEFLRRMQAMYGGGSGRVGSDSGRANSVTAINYGLASLVLGIISLVVPMLGLPAIITGLVALRKINSAKGKLTGRRKAIAGIILGCLDIIKLPFVLAFYFHR